MIREKLAAKRGVVGVFAAVLNWLGPGWITPFTGAFYGMIGPLMWWHWARVDRRLKQLPAVTTT